MKSAVVPSSQVICVYVRMCKYVCTYVRIFTYVCTNIPLYVHFTIIIIISTLVGLTCELLNSVYRENSTWSDCTLLSYTGISNKAASQREDWILGHRHMWGWSRVRCTVPELTTHNVNIFCQAAVQVSSREVNGCQKLLKFLWPLLH